MKLNVGLIGKGQWGKKIESKLLILANLCFVCGSKDNFLKEIKKKKIKWVFIATPNNTHYSIVKKCIQYGINVYCEKPLCLSYSKAKNLIAYSKKKKAKIFVSDLYDYYSKKIKKLKSINNVFRSKQVLGKNHEFLFRLMYHDISILYNLIKSKKIKSIFKKKSVNKKIIELLIKFNNNVHIQFNYNLNQREKKHFINKICISSKKDLLKIMINNVLLNKVDFKKNISKALFTIKFLNKIEKQI